MSASSFGQRFVMTTFEKVMDRRWVWSLMAVRRAFRSMKGACVVSLRVDDRER